MKRPATPHINVDTTIDAVPQDDTTAPSQVTRSSDVSISQSRSLKENIFRNFNFFMKQIIDSENTNFLNGNINIHDYILAKYLNVNYQDIEKMEKISIKINADYGLWNQFGERLKNLLVLKLNDSFIQSISDIGSSFRNWKILQMNNCKLKDLSGIICFQNLEVWEATNNKIDDWIEWEMCTSIQKINLESNWIEKEENISFLGFLENWTYINLRKNPICGKCNYRDKLLELNPGLKCIDGEENICVLDQETFTPSVPSSSAEEVKEGWSVSNLNSTNEGSPLIPTGLKTDNQFNSKQKEIEKDPEKSSNVLNKQDIEWNKTTSNFKLSMNVDLGSSTNFNPSLKPVIKKKEENSQIKYLRESFQSTGTQGSLLNKGKNTGNTFMQSSIINKKLDKVVVKKDANNRFALLNQLKSKKNWDEK